MPALTGQTPSGSSWFNGQNRIQTWGYDDMGNVTGVVDTPGQPADRQFIYDAENRMVQATIGGVAASYTYDGDGRRVTKTSGGATTTFVYDTDGQLAQEYGPPPTDSGTDYLSTDHLGSTRLITDGSGSPKKRFDYLPFGEELTEGTGGRLATMGYNTASTATQTDLQSIKFTGKERDAETGLDFFGFRYMSSAQGRFTSPDPDNAGADPTNPQSWNMYSYVLNNPLVNVDPNGTCTVVNGQYQDDGGDPCPAAPSDSVTVTDKAPPANTQTSTLGDLSYLFITTVTATAQLAQQTQQAFQPVLDWFSRPGDPLCTASYTGVGASIGFWAGGGLGTLGLAGGPAAAATIPGGAAGGAALGGGIGGIGGMIMCTQGTGQSGGGTSSGGAQDKKLSPSEIRKLENATGESAHQIKSEALGTNKNIAQFDLYKDTQGNVFVKGKGGVGEAIPTGLKIN